jgi:hypothetical protein
MSLKRWLGMTQFLTSMGFMLLLHAPTLQAEESLQPNFAFSSYYGSGIYNSGGSDLTVLNMPIAFDTRDVDMYLNTPTRLRLPVSIGYSNFDKQNIQDTKLIEDAGALSLGVGLDQDYWESSFLKFVPFFDIGYAEDLSNHQGAFTYALGMSVFQYLEFWDDKQILFGKMQHAGFIPFEDSSNENFNMLQVGTDIKIPARFYLGEISTFVSVYATSYYYLVDLTDSLSRIDVSALQDQWAHEIGFTWGLVRPLMTPVYDFERIGVGYRYSKKGEDLIRVTFNFPLE